MFKSHLLGFVRYGFIIIIYVHNYFPKHTMWFKRLFLVKREWSYILHHKNLIFHRKNGREHLYVCVLSYVCRHVWVCVCCTEPRLLMWQMFGFIQMKMANNTVCSLASGVWWIRVLALSLPCESLHMLLRNDTHQTTSRHVKQTLRGGTRSVTVRRPTAKSILPSNHPSLPLFSSLKCLLLLN